MSLLTAARDRLPTSIRTRVGLLLKPAMTEMLRFAVNSTLCRGLLFDQSKDKYLLVDGQETFVVVTTDKVISRALFVDRRSAEFDKLERVMRLIDAAGALDCIVDVGANIGNICIPAVKRRLANRAIAIEPEPANFAVLGANVRLNGLNSAIDLFNSALGPHDGEELQLSLSIDNGGDHRVVVGTKYSRRSAETISVRSTTLDTLLGDKADSGKVLIWMDVQGYEGHVLQGARRVLTAGLPLVIEYSPELMMEAKSFELLKAAVLSSRYTQFFDLNSSSSVATRLTAANLDRLYRSLGEEGVFTDLLITP